jgi:hypothetical protein
VIFLNVPDAILTFANSTKETVASSACDGNHILNHNFIKWRAGPASTSFLNLAAMQQNHIVPPHRHLRFHVCATFASGLLAGHRLRYPRSANRVGPGGRLVKRASSISSLESTDVVFTGSRAYLMSDRTLTIRQLLGIMISTCGIDLIFASSYCGCLAIYITSENDSHLYRDIF